MIVDTFYCLYIILGKADSGIGDSFSSRVPDSSFGSDRSTSFQCIKDKGERKSDINEGVICLIDCCEPMFQQRTAGEDSPFQRSPQSRLES